LGGTCGTLAGGEKGLWGFGWEASKVRDHWEDLVNILMNLRVP